MNTDDRGDPEKQRIEGEAISWLLELNSSEIEPTLRRWLAFDAWLTTSFLHEEIYCRFEANFERLQCQMALDGANPGTGNTH